MDYNSKLPISSIGRWYKREPLNWGPFVEKEQLRCRRSLCGGARHMEQQISFCKTAERVRIAYSR